MRTLIGRKPTALILIAIVGTVSLLAPTAQSALPGASTVHAVVTGGFNPTGDGRCDGSMSVTTDRPLLATENAIVLVQVNRCEITSASVIADPVPRTRYDPCADGCSKGEGDAPARTTLIAGHAEWDTRHCSESCGKTSSLVIDVYQQYHAADGDNLQSDDTGVNCATTNDYQVDTCENFQGTTYGSELSTLGKSHVQTSPQSYIYDLYGYATLYTYFDGRHRMECAFSGNAAYDTTQVTCT